MASIYDSITGDSITGGLQGCNTCDEAIDAARRIAAERGESVHLSDDDGEWLVYPDGRCEPAPRTDAEDDEADEDAERDDAFDPSQDARVWNRCDECD